jgi:hypothetical protein
MTSSSALQIAARQRNEVCAIHDKLTLTAGALFLAVGVLGFVGAVIHCWGRATQIPLGVKILACPAGLLGCGYAVFTILGGSRRLGDRVAAALDSSGDTAFNASQAAETAAQRRLDEAQAVAQQMGLPSIPCVHKKTPTSQTLTLYGRDALSAIESHRQIVHLKEAARFFLILGLLGSLGAVLHQPYLTQIPLWSKLFLAIYGLSLAALTYYGATIRLQRLEILVERLADRNDSMAKAHQRAAELAAHAAVIQRQIDRALRPPITVPELYQAIIPALSNDLPLEVLMALDPREQVGHLGRILSRLAGYKRVANSPVADPAGLQEKVNELRAHLVQQMPVT